MDDKVVLTPERATELDELLMEKKFVKESLYPGAPNEEIRMESQGRVDRFVSDVLQLVARGATREELFARAKALKKEFENDDTEEIERADDYVGAVMRIVGIDDWTKRI